MTETNIFISYSRSDSDFVIKLEEDLAKVGIDIWLDQKKIAAGKLWDREIDKALKSSGILILAISPNSAHSDNVANEVLFAINRGKTVIPVLIEQTDDIPFNWERFQRIDLTNDYEKGLNYLAQSLHHELSVIQKSGKEKEEQGLKKEAEAKAKAEEEKRVKAEAEAKRIEEAKAKAKTKNEEDKRIKDEEEAQRKAEEKKQLKVEAEAKQKAEEEKRIKEQAEKVKKEKELAASSVKSIETSIFKNPRYKIPIIIASVIAVLVIVIWIVNSGNNNINYPTDTDQTVGVQNDNSEENAWKDAISLNTIESYKTYQQNYKVGKYFNEAQTRINKIVDKNDWDSASTLQTKEAYQEYIQKQPNGFWKADATKKIADLEQLALQKQEQKSQPSTIKKPTPKYVTYNGVEGVKIGNQIWMAKNLDVITYRNGDPIPEVKDPAAWEKLTTGAWCYYKNDPANGAVYGKLYNWYAVNDPRGLAPKGWHLPADYEWTTLTSALGGEKIAGGKLKESGTTRWESPNKGATNESGFSALPGGYRSYSGDFSGIGHGGYWWSSTENSPSNAWDRHLNTINSYIHRGHSTKEYGFSVRCVRD